MPYVTVNGITYWQAPTTPPPPAEPVAMPAAVAIGLAVIRAWATPGPERVRLPDGGFSYAAKDKQ